MTPPQPFSHASFADLVQLPDDSLRKAALDRQARLTKPAGALGRLEPLSAWLASVTGTCPPPPLDRVRVVIFAGDHGVARTARTSAYPPEVTAQMVLNFIAGGAGVNALAELNGASVRVLDMSVDADLGYLGSHEDTVGAHRIRRGSGSIDREDALTYDEAMRAFNAGREVADEEIDRGVDLLIPGDMGIGNTTPTATIIGLLTRTEIQFVVGRGTGIDDTTWMRKSAAVRDAMRRGRPRMGDPIDLLAAVGGADLAAMTGLLVQAAIRRTPVLLDGVVSAAAALLAQAINYRTPQWFVASHRSTEPAQHAALEYLDLKPLIDLDLRLGEGTGALIALPIVRAAQVTLANMATFEEAGVSDKDAETDSTSDQDE
jgi:nicotinate-nucleotide--dimethylbenzimidazole phosphoribosyltransferase